MMTFVKICGITSLDDALAAVAAGADALGFNFYKPSPRYIEPRAAGAIVAQLPDSVLTVGVFVNEDSPHEVLNIAGEAGIKALQLHGDESPEYCRQLATGMRPDARIPSKRNCTASAASRMPMMRDTTASPVMPSSRCLSPLEYCRGTRPSQAASCRPFSKALAFP